MIEYNQPIGNVRFVNSLKTFKNIVKEIIELVRKQRNITNFFIKNEGFNFCFVNFKDLESYIQNDLMLAKVKITGEMAYVIWVNGMTSKIKVSELNIVPLTAASISNNRRINPNPQEEGSLESMANGESPNSVNFVKNTDKKEFIVEIYYNPESISDYHTFFTDRSDCPTPHPKNSVKVAELTCDNLHANNLISATCGDISKFLNSNNLLNASLNKDNSVGKENIVDFIRTIYQHSISGNTIDVQYGLEQLIKMFTSPRETDKGSPVKKD